MKCKYLFSGVGGRCIGCYGVAFAVMLLEWVLMKENLKIEYSNSFGTVLKAVGDICLFLLPYWLLSPRWRWSLIFLLWGLAAWCVANLAYFRFWNEMIPPASIIMGGNIDSSLMEYGMSLLRWTDAWYIACPLVATVAIVAIRPGLDPALSVKAKVIVISLSVIAAVIGQLSYFKTAYSWRTAIAHRSFREALNEQFVGGYTGQRQLYESNGMAYYVVRFATDAIGLLTDRKILSEEERKEIDYFLCNYRKPAGACADSINVVYIIVESLNADMLGKKVAGRPVMPTLDSLARLEGTVLIDNVVSQIKAASSSDGHLLLMTGLLPPDKTAYSITYGASNKFPSIADALGSRHKYLLLADEGICWNEGNTLRNFGLGEPLAIKDRPQLNPDIYGRDGAMFLQAADMIRSGEVKEPFLMTLMTISMHIPFREKAWPLPAFLKNAEGLTQMERNYANMCSHTDTCIGDFLKALPGNTIVFIASDHHQSIASDGPDGSRAFFMALNTGHTAHISRTVGQVNLFPAVLEILGCAPVGYGGLATSAFNPSVDGTVDSYGNIYGKPSRETLDSLATAYRLSDLIIRGDYFKESDPEAKGR